MKKIKIGSLCTGYGGLDMAVESYFNAESVWVSEIDSFASQLLKHRINKPNLGDLKIIDWEKVESIDILTAGYPCQPFSTAGSRKGAKDERHLWPYIKQAISILRPGFVVLENVRGHFSLGFREVLGDLTEIGYNARWQLIRASDVGAPHRRERLFIVAYRGDSYEYSNTYSQRRSLVGNRGRENRNQRKSQSVASGLVSSVIADSDSLSRNNERRKHRDLYGETKQEFHGSNRIKPRFSLEMAREAIPSPLDKGKLNPVFVEYMMGLPKGWVTDVGLSRIQQLKILGNGVVPQQALLALNIIMRDIKAIDTPSDLRL